MDISADRFAEYKRNRARGMTAMCAGRKWPEPSAPEWLRGLDYDSPRSGEVDGFEITARVVPDDYSRLGEDSITGTFTDQESETTVPCGLSDAYRNYFKYYEPPEILPEPPESITRGASKSVREDLRRAAIAEAMHDDLNRSYYGVIVTASRNEIELGDASLWGIDVIGYDDLGYFAEVAAECIAEAIDQARDALASLCDTDPSC